MTQQTSLGLTYPEAGDHTRIWEHFQTLANDTDQVIGDAAGRWVIFSETRGVTTGATGAYQWLLPPEFGGVPTFVSATPLLGSNLVIASAGALGVNTANFVFWSNWTTKLTNASLTTCHLFAARSIDWG